MKILIRWVITAVALFIAAELVPGIQVAGDGWTVYAAMAVILALVNAVIRPILKLLTCPLIMLTLGIFVLVINAFTLWLASELAQGLFGVGFVIDGFWPALLGSIIVSVVSIILNAIVKEEDDED
jgi:putative membrane protein